MALPPDDQPAKDPLLLQFEPYLRQACRLSPGRPVLVACSGGLDSVVLADLLRLCGQRPGLAHAQFHLRGQDSLDDEALVRDLAQQWGLPFFRTDLDARACASRLGISLQMAARTLRYAWFESLRASQGYHRIATAHHRDDQAETALMRLLQGSGWRGLKGILPARDRLIRPLLFSSKSQLREYARRNQLSWREDQSNAQPDYLRNRLRLEILPRLEELFPGASGQLAASASALQQAGILYQAGLDTWSKRLLRKSKRGWALSLVALQQSGAADTLLEEWLLPLGYTAAQIRGIAATLNQPGPRHWPGPQGLLIQERGRLIWSAFSAGEDPIALSSGSSADQAPAAPAERAELRTKVGEPVHSPPGPVSISRVPARVRCGSWQLSLSTVTKNRLKQPHRGVLLDAAALEWPLLLRPWQPGDYFHPEGHGGKRKIKRFLTDQKVPQAERAAVLVLQSGSRIAWVVGYRADARFAAKPQAGKTLLKISFRKWR
jgi:tRNA(Ile)-lysidine synthase